MKILSVFGTRPEAIKMAPVIRAIASDPSLEGFVCVTAQHRRMLDQVLRLFDIRPDFDLNVMRPGQHLNELAARVISDLDGILTQLSPDLVLVHGDTTTTLATAIASFHRRVPIGHIEAGLRTGDLFSPWPEEANRCLTGKLASLHFAPTEAAKENLIAEGHSPESVLVTGNTVIDALLEVDKILNEEGGEAARIAAREFDFLLDRPVVLITCHRRENFGDGLSRVCEAIRSLAQLFPCHAFVYPVHLNPNVQIPVKERLGGFRNVHLIAPLDYLPFVYLMRRSLLILTDSGGVQEEAPSLGVPVLVLRDKTERPEAVMTGAVRVVGTDVEKIVAETSKLLIDSHARADMGKGLNPFGDGRAAERIISEIRRWRASGEARVVPKIA